jgi:hypothetical protein
VTVVIAPDETSPTGWTARWLGERDELLTAAPVEPAEVADFLEADRIAEEEARRARVAALWVARDRRFSCCLAGCLLLALLVVLSPALIAVGGSLVRRSYP